MSTGTSSDISTQSSYYLLYKQLSINRIATFSKLRSEIKTDQCRTQPAAPLLDGSSDLDHNVSSGGGNETLVNQNYFAYWEQDEWTDKDEMEAKILLDQNLYKCDIIASSPCRGAYLIQKYEKEAGLNWDKFYTSHQTKFFKDRHYLDKAFPLEFGNVYGEKNSGRNNTKKDYQGFPAEEMGDFRIVEIGCGVGNTVLPLLELNSILFFDSVHEAEKKRKQKHNTQNKILSVWGLDFSSVAIDLLKKDQRYIRANTEKRSQALVWDITSTHPRDVSSHLENSGDISLLLFCLSAISPDKMPQAAKYVAATLKPGGMLLFRDYGRYDEAQLKLGTSRAKRLANNFYAKHDGTRCYYFDLNDLERLFGTNGNYGAGLEIVELKYINRIYRNRAEEVIRRRVWVQGRFRKPTL